MAGAISRRDGKLAAASPSYGGLESFSDAQARTPSLRRVLD
jgi:hypothetical protein